MKDEPAFHDFNIEYNDNSMSGLTKRDYFASMAMQGILASTNYRCPVDEIPENAIGLADALLNALEKRGEAEL